MTPARRLWLLLALEWISASAAVALGFAHANGRLPPEAAAAAGASVGLALFVVLAGRRPAVRGRLGPVAAGTLGVLGAKATSEEVLWRAVLLARLVPFGGALAALAASTAWFALAHRHGRAVHVLTGGTFGATYLAAGLVAAVAAHVAYNVLIALTLQRTTAL